MLSHVRVLPEMLLKGSWDLFGLSKVSNMERDEPMEIAAAAG